MLPASPSSPGTIHTIKMLAIMEQWEEASGHHRDNTVKFLLLFLFKSGLDTAFFCSCFQKWYNSFLSVCSLSIILVDWMMTFFMATMWFLGAKRFLVSPCFFLAESSEVFGALPLPVMCLGLLDYCVDDTRIGRHRPFSKFLRNVFLTVLVWIQAVIYSSGSINGELMETNDATGEKFMVCEVEESTLIAFFIVGLFSVLILTMLPFWSRIPQWVQEADRLYEATQDEENKKSSLFNSKTCTETESSKENYLKETNYLRPPLWFSLTLGFALFWMPYLGVCTICLLFSMRAPSYIAVNVLWLECTNSVLVGVVFWVKSKKLRPYSHLPENLCPWSVYWHLSRGLSKQQLPAGVINPSKQKENTLLCV